jgi:hypothetical protein
VYKALNVWLTLLEEILYFALYIQVQPQYYPTVNENVKELLEIKRELAETSEILLGKLFGTFQL